MATRVSSQTFVGRRRELERVGAALAGAGRGKPALVLVAGEAGVGKTRFVHEIADRARSSGARVLEGGCVPLGADGLPFAPFIEALRGLASQLSEAELDALVEGGRQELSRLLPTLVRPGTGLPASGFEDGSEQGRLFEHLLTLLGRLGQQAPVLVVVEDIHWADQSTIALLGFLSRNLREGRIVLIATYRSDELHQRHLLLPFLAEEERAGRAERVELSRFDRAEVAAQLSAILGVEAGSELVDRIAARSQGNAFYAEELAAARDQGSRLSNTLREILLARVASLGDATQAVVRMAAAGGARVRPALLARVAATDEVAIESAIHEALTEHVLVRHSERGQERYAFRHALVQEAVYHELLPSERVRLHAAFAEALADDEGDEIDASRAAELAYHRQEARDLPRAFDAWILAAMAAEGVYAFADAAASYDRAIELWDQVAAAEARAPFDRVELLSRAAVAAESTAPARSAGYIRQALDLVDPTTNPARAGLLYEQLGEFTTLLVDVPNAMLAYREAVRLVPADPPSAARARVLTGLGRCLGNLHRHRESMATSEEALRAALAVGAPREESRALYLLATSQVALGAVETGLANCRRAFEIADEVGDVYAASRALTLWSFLLSVAGQYDAAVTAGFDAYAYAKRYGLTSRFGTTDLSHAARGLIALGRWDEAAAALHDADRHGGLRDSDVNRGLLLLDALRGQFESAEARIDHLSSDKGWFYPERAELALWRHDPLRARSEIQEQASFFDAQPEVNVNAVGPATVIGLRAEADLADAARARRSGPELRQARDIGGALLARMRTLMAEVTTERSYDMRQVGAWMATCEAEFSRLEGAPDPGQWAVTAAAWEALRMPYFRAYALMREAEAALVAERDRRRAIAVLTTARAIAVRLGAEPLRLAVDDLAARAVGRSRPASATKTGSAHEVQPGRERRRASGAGEVRPVGVGDGLTPRERDVVRLLASGKSDGEIAQALFITKKTASSHVAHIKDKLGAGSRVEIATSAIGLGLAEAP